MKILCICDQGNNRSVNLSHRLKYWGNDTIPIGLKNTTIETLTMLFEWADIILCTDNNQEIPIKYIQKRRICDIGEDKYPRPLNSDLDKIVKDYLDINKNTFKII